MTDKYIVPEMTTRRMILTLLKTQGPVGVGSLAAQLGITEMGVRRHLKLMEQDGLIVATIVRQAMGRPTFLYSLSEQGSEQFPRNYDHLLLELLEELDEEQGIEAVHSLFDGRKRKMMKRYAPHMENETTLVSRVEKLSGIQNASGYMADWREEEDGSYSLVEYNCPISQIAGRYRKACECEQQMFEELLDAEVVREDCLADGGRSCLYRIRSRKK